MADSKLADLTAITSPADADLLYVVADPAGTPVDRKVTVANLRGLGKLLAYTDYRPASDSTLSTTSLSYADVDATNMAVTFTAPPSGKVVVDLTAYCATSSSAVTQFWALRNGSTTVTGSETGVVASAQALRAAPSLLITGLTPGTSYTYKWAWKLGQAGTGYMYVGPTYANAHMRVWAVT